MSGLVVHVQPRSLVAVLGLALDAAREVARPVRGWLSRN